MTAPTVLGYADLKKIGAGGFAVVYRATQAAVGREVALKLLHTAIDDPEIERRFARECRVVGSLSWHPHIAAVLDAGIDDSGRSYLAFELLPGGSLGDRLKEHGPVPWGEAVNYAIQTADALEAAHAEEVLHRDVKPDNILLDRIGRAKLADFGIAQMRDGTRTETGVITATLAHAAPEVLAGQRATKASDVYLLGSTLFELIAGEPPFGRAAGSDLFAAIQRIGTEPPPFLASLPDVDCPRDVAEAVDHALRKDPAERPASAAALGEALRAAQQAAGRPATAMPFVESQNTDPPGAGPFVQSESGKDRNADESHVSRTQIVASPTPLVEQPLADAGRSNPSAVPRQGPAASGASGGSRRGLLAGLSALLLAAAFGAFLLLNGDSLPPAIQPIEALQTGSQQGLGAANLIDSDLGTGWLSPNAPNGHEVVIGFGQIVDLEAITIHAGPNPEATGPLDGARAVGPVVLQFSDGTELERTLDRNLSMQTVPINLETSSIAIRSLESGPAPIAIREIEFHGTVPG